ncbi:uncharacterized protein LOC100377009 [Saccoglossus kowalevskii]
MDPTVQKRKQLALSAALGCLQNLCKVSENKAYYREPERNALKWLDIYKGSPDEVRRIMSLLILSYIIDPETETDLVFDTEGIIDILKSKLAERVLGQSNEFSTHELIEGLEKLSVNADNKAKIISQSLEFIQTVLLTGSEKERRCANKALKTLGYDAEEFLPVQSKKTEEDPSEKEVSKIFVDALEFVRDMLCVLDAMDSFVSDEMTQIVNAIVTNGCNNLTREEREAVADSLVDNGIAELLMKILTDLIKDRELVYKDNQIFAIFYGVLSIIWNYSDASLVFSSALGKEGVVKFMFDICESYYMDKREEMFQLSAAMGIKRDDEKKVTNNPPPKKEETSDEQLNDTPPSEDEYYFKIAHSSQDAKLLNSCKTASRVTCDSIRKAVFISNKPLETGYLFEIQVDKFIEGERYIGSPEFGVTIHCDIPEDVTYTGEGLGRGTGFWMLRHSEFIKDFKLIGGGYPLQLLNVKVGDCIGIIRFPDSTIHYFWNGQDMGVAFRNVPQNIYVLLCVDANWEKVTLKEVKEIAMASELVESTEKRGNKVHNIQDKFEFTTVSGSKFSGKKLVFPYGTDFVDPDVNPEEYQILEKATSTDNTELVDAFSHVKEGLDELHQINQVSAEKGYLNERDMENVIQTIKAMVSIQTDPVTSIPLHVLGNVVDLAATCIYKFLKLKLDDTDELKMGPKLMKVTGRFADILENVVIPCFDNLKGLSSYVWTGSTSEGFAFVDEYRDQVYINDEIDIMVPIATVNEQSEFGERPSNAISELEWASNNTGSCTLLEMKSGNHPGYVRVFASSYGSAILSDNSITNIFIQSETNGKIAKFLSRSKILKSQEHHVRGRFPCVQQQLIERFKDGSFTGRLDLVQEGPAQTLCIQFPIGTGPKDEEYLFEQMVDVTLALRCQNWPDISRPWITRQRLWPDANTVQKIVDDGCHVVPKAYPGEGGDVDLDWRLSFSLAERTLALSVNEIQRNCYLVLKSFWRRFLKKPKVLSSYHLKTTLFWRCEKIPPIQWTKENMGERFLELIDDIIAGLTKRNIPNFFIPENNMLSHVLETDILEVLEKVKDVRRNPLAYFNRYNSLLTNNFSFFLTKP